MNSEANEIRTIAGSLTSIYARVLPGGAGATNRSAAEDEVNRYIQNLVCAIFMMDSTVHSEESRLLGQLYPEKSFAGKDVGILDIYREIFAGNSRNIDLFIKNTPAFVDKIIHHDRQQGTSHALDALALISELGRTAIAIDGADPESEVVALQLHLSSIQASLHEAGISAPDETDSNPPEKQTKTTKTKAETKRAKRSSTKDSASMDGLLFELSGLIGLQEVKKEVASLVNLIKVQKMREERGMPALPMSHHLVFTGNPGTGKTIVARLLSKIFKSLGLLESGHLVEVDRSGLVAGYLGQTSLKVKEVISESLGGVLFIDEAYSLANGEGESDYGQEAIDILVKEMEDNREDFIVIAAGYPNEMGRFIKSNPGLKARFNKYIHFPDYNADEMTQIFNFICEKAGYNLTESAKQQATTVFQEITAQRQEGFGNGREARNIFERCVQKHANRIAKIKSPSNEDLVYLDVIDFG